MLVEIDICNGVNRRQKMFTIFFSTDLHLLFSRNVCRIFVIRYFIRFMKLISVRYIRLYVISTYLISIVIISGMGKYQEKKRMRTEFYDIWEDWIVSDLTFEMYTACSLICYSCSLVSICVKS